MAEGSLGSYRVVSLIIGGVIRRRGFQYMADLGREVSIDHFNVRIAWVYEEGDSCIFKTVETTEW